MLFSRAWFSLSFMALQGSWLNSAFLNLSLYFRIQHQANGYSPYLKNKSICVTAPTFTGFLSNSWSVILTAVLGNGRKCHGRYSNDDLSKEILLCDIAVSEVLVSDDSNLFPLKKVIGSLYKNKILVMSKW